MSRSVLRSMIFLAAIVFVGCKTEVSPQPAPDAGSAPDAGLKPFDGGAPVDGGPVCPPTYPTATLGGIDCDPMVPAQCGFPFPSNVYTQLNASSPTCLNVNFGATTLPVLNNNHLDPTAYSDSDGFSTGNAALTYMAGATTNGTSSTYVVGGMPDQFHLGDSIAVATTPTILLDTSTSPPSLVPNFAEIDITDPSTPSDQAILIHPMIRLKDNTRYIVAIRNIQDSTGAAIPPSATFKALRDGTAAPTISVNGTMMTDPSVASRTALYTDIFAKLQAAGIPKTNASNAALNLQIAWDYTTASAQNNTQQMESMYTQALAALPSAGPTYTITSNTPNPDPMTAYRIRGFITVPLFLDQAKVTIDSNPLNPDLTTGYTMQRTNGIPAMNGTGQFEFLVNIPKSAVTSIQPYPVLLQGHGLFSDRGEAMNALDNNYDSTIQLEQNQGYIHISVDMIAWRQCDTANTCTYDSSWPSDFGMYPDTNQENDQEKALGFVSNDLGGFRRMIDRGTQGVLNELIAMKMMLTSFATDPAVMVGLNNQSVIDTTQAYYRGDSQGAITGVTFMALSHDVQRGYVTAGGNPYNLIIFRSGAFSEFLGILLGNYGTGNPAMNVQLVGGLMQMFWDRWEGNGFIPFLTANTLSSDTPSHHIFLSVAIGDQTVTNIAAKVLVRSIGAVELLPAPSYDPTPYGITQMNGPFGGQNVFHDYSFGLESLSGYTIYPTDTPASDSCGGCDNPHDWTRQTPSAYLETDEFLKHGEAVDYCGTGGPDGGMPEVTTACVYPSMEP